MGTIGTRKGSRLLVVLATWNATYAAAPLFGQESPATLRVADDHAAAMKAGLALFESQVRTILERHCLECHGGGTVKAGFDLSNRAAMLKSPGAVEPGRPRDESRLWLMVAHEDDPPMPYKAAKLADDEIDALGRWIELGAPFDRPLVEPSSDERQADAPRGPTQAERDFWSFRPLEAIAPPTPRDTQGWACGAIDRFILADLEAHGLHPNPRADRRTLIRRVTFDLIGLPPTPEEIDAFLTDPRDDVQAYDALVDRLLASPHFGERWARHWLDVARFAESHGYEQDYDRPHAYLYRDWLIRAFNEDLPYDEFIRRQLAGDELHPDDPWSMVATGFLGGGAFPTQLTEAEFESARYDELDDMTATTGVAFLGLTLGCARCHDHKYDPIRMSDYYSVAAVFTTTIRSEIELPLGPSGQIIKAQVCSEGFKPTKHHADDRGFPHFYPETHVLERGDPKRKLGLAQPGYPAVLVRHGRDPDHWKVTPPQGWTRTSFRRAALANWLTDPADGAGHLAARVIVNRLWHHHFGRGIVATPSDFGFQGARPTHPKLLDWLAVDLIHHGWRLKRLHKAIVTSATYTQSTAYDSARAALDRDNRLWWRREPRRLEAEAIRDALLACSGRLDRTPYGPGSLDETMTRRSVYFFIKRSQLIPTMMLFDWPEHLVSLGARSQTTIAPQALAFLNGPQTRADAEALAGRVAREAGDDPEARLERLGVITLGRPPAAWERDAARDFLADQVEIHRASGRNPDDAARLAWIDLAHAWFGLNEFLYID